MLAELNDELQLEDSAFQSNEMQLMFALHMGTPHSLRSGGDGTMLLGFAVHPSARMVE